MFETLIKDPDALLDYVVDWAPWLTASGDTISGALWIVTPGIVVASSSFTTLDATVRLSGGLLDALYEITCRITTAGGRVNDRTFGIRIRNQ